MPDLSQSEIDAAVEVCQRATAAPWEVVRSRDNHWGMVEVTGPGVGGRLVIGFTVATAERAAAIEADAELIALARTLLPLLLAEVQQLRGSDATVVELEAELDVARKKIAALLAERREREAKLADFRQVLQRAVDDQRLVETMQGMSEWYGDALELLAPPPPTQGI